MFDSQLLIAKDTTLTIFSPWFPRGGDNAIFSLDVIDVDGTPSLAVDIFTKNSEDTGEGAMTGISFSMTGTTAGVTTTRLESTKTNGMLELVRYQFKLTAGNAGDWILFRMLPTSWYDDVR